MNKHYKNPITESCLSSTKRTSFHGNVSYSGHDIALKCKVGVKQHLLTLNTTGLTHFCTCSKLGPGFPTYYVVVFLALSVFSLDERWLFVLMILVELITITV